MILITGLMFTIFCLCYISLICGAIFLPFCILRQWLKLDNFFNKENVKYILKIKIGLVVSGLYLIYLSSYPMNQFLDTAKANLAGIIFVTILVQVLGLAFTLVDYKRSK